MRNFTFTAIVDGPVAITNAEGFGVQFATILGRQAAILWDGHRPAYVTAVGIPVLGTGRFAIESHEWAEDGTGAGKFIVTK